MASTTGQSVGLIMTHTVINRGLHHEAIHGPRHGSSHGEWPWVYPWDTPWIHLSMGYTMDPPMNDPKGRSMPGVHGQPMVDIPGKPLLTVIEHVICRGRPWVGPWLAHGLSNKCTADYCPRPTIIAVVLIITVRPLFFGLGLAATLHIKVLGSLQ